MITEIKPHIIDGMRARARRQMLLAANDARKCEDGCAGCAGCRYWSEMLAQAIGGGPLQAMCIAPAPAEFRLNYTTRRMKCSAWAAGPQGAIDDPAGNPYAAESPEDERSAA